MTKNKLIALFAFPAMTAELHAVVVVLHEYHLGEAGTLSSGDKRPLDSQGQGDFSQSLDGGYAVVGSAGVFAPGSSAYLDTSSGHNTGWYLADFSDVPTDNFGMGIFARASQMNTGDIFGTGNEAVKGAFKLALYPQGWAASAHNIAWIGTFQGTPGSFTPDEWVHLALIRQNGVATFYIDGVAQGSYSGIPHINSGHLSVAPSGYTFFDGHIDEARIVAFGSSDSTESILGGLQGIPEPSLLTLLGLGLSSSVLRRRRRS